MPPTPDEVLKRIAELEAAEIKDDAQWFNIWADYWRYVVGVNVMPADTRNKTINIKWTEYQTNPISEEQHNKWKQDAAFNSGMAIIMGKVWHNPLKLGLSANGIDADNHIAIEEICNLEDLGKSKCTLQQLANWTIAEQHKDAPDKLHIIIYSEKPFLTKSSNKNNPELNPGIDANTIPAIEVKGPGTILFVSPSFHKGGHPYEILDTLEPATYDAFEKHIDNICRKYGIPYLEIDNGKGKAQIPIEELHKKDCKIYKGNNRHEALLRIMESLLAKNKDILSLEEIKQLSIKRNEERCVPPLDDREFEKQWRSATRFIERKSKEREKEIEEFNKQIDQLNRKRDKQDTPSDDNNNNTGPAATEQPATEQTELEGRAQKLIQTYLELKELITPEFLKQLYSIKTTRPDKEIFYFDSDRGVYLPDGEIVIEQELEGMNDKLTVLYDEILMVMDEFYKKIEDDEERNKKIYERLKEEGVIQPKPWKKRDIDEFRYHIERQTYFYRNNFNPDIEWLAGEDCMINLLTGETAPFHPKYLNTTYIPVKYHVYEPNPLARINKEYCSCPEIMKFLNGIMEPDDVEIVLDFIAYCLWREYKFHNWLLLNGAGQNGKSTLLRLIARFLGSHNVSGESLQRILERDFASAQLYGKLANIDADLSTESLKNTGLLKKLTGGDKLTAEFKNKQIFEFTNYAKLIFSANQIPISEDMTDAFFRRPIIINLTRQFFEDADLNIDKKITTEAELSGLLRVCLQRLPRVVRNGIRQTTNETIRKTQEQYLRSANPLKYFVEKALNTNYNEKTPKDTVYDSYKRFCRYFKLAVESEQAFSRKLTSEYGYQSKQFRDKSKGKNVYYWLNLKVSDWLTIEDESQKYIEELTTDTDTNTDTPPPVEDQPTK